MSAFARALILTGPTACGKSALALELAERAGAEIVAVDSMTVYRGMDIGTAKPSPVDRARVPHHLIDTLDPWESPTVAWWLERAAEACRDIEARGKRPLLVGGTPFYLKALLHGLFPGPPADGELRQRLEAEAATWGNEALHRRLAAVDPRTALRLHPNDVRRVVRALEVYELTGKPISAWQQTWDSPAFAGNSEATPPAARIPGVVLEMPRNELYQRIDKRVSTMLEAGWLAEVEQLLLLPRPMSREARQALGYRELLAYREDSEQTWDEVIEAIRTHTRQFAKRQLTWFRHFSQLIPMKAGETGLLEGVYRIWEEFDRSEIDTDA
jgi:tRNA dimethylallyltransferase